MGLLKAALLYADRVKLCSVGASFMSALDDLRNMDLKGKSNIVRQAMAHIPGATHESLEQTYRILDAASGSRRGSSRRGVTGPKLFEARRLIETGWQPIKHKVEEQFRAVGGEGFDEALQSGLVELHPFTSISPEGIVEMGRRGNLGIPPNINADETYNQYVARIYQTVQDGRTYPLFDDLTGNIVGEAIRNGLIQPSQGEVARGRHGGLSGDLLQRLPLFEKSSIAEVLDIRRELAPYLDAFRQAVAQFANAIGPASWDEDFQEEAERVYREQIATAVRQIEQAVQDNRELRGLSLRYAPPALAGAAAAINAFVGHGSILASLALVAAGVVTGVAAHTLHHSQTQGKQL